MFCNLPLFFFLGCHTPLIFFFRGLFFFYFSFQFVNSALSFDSILRTQRTFVTGRGSNLPVFLESNNGNVYGRPSDDLLSEVKDLGRWEAYASLWLVLHQPHLPVGTRTWRSSNVQDLRLPGLPGKKDVKRSVERSQRIGDTGDGRGRHFTP